MTISKWFDFWYCAAVAYFIVGGIALSIDKNLAGIIIILMGLMFYSLGLKEETLNELKNIRGKLE